jgi:chaperonin GroEL
MQPVRQWKKALSRAAVWCWSLHLSPWTSKSHGEEKSGVKILRRALEEPLRQIVNNAGIDGTIVLNKVMEGKDDFGFNAATEVYENLVAAGVIDPTKVVRFALQNAASVAGLMITTEAMIAEKPKKKKGAGASDMPMDDYGDDEMY